MRANRNLQRQVGENIAIVDDEGISSKEILHIFDSTRGLEKIRFVAKVDRSFPIGVARENRIIGFGTMMGVNDETFDAGFEQVVKSAGDQRLVRDRNQRLRQTFGKRPKPCPEPGTEDKGSVNGGAQN